MIEVKELIIIDRKNKKDRLMDSMKSQLTYRFATPDDCRLYFDWANDETVRTNSFSTNAIEWEAHERWFLKKVVSGDTYLLMFFSGAEPVGQLRMELASDTILNIDLSVDRAWRGKKIGRAIMMTVREISDRFFPSMRIKGVICQHNIASIRALEYAGFVKEEEVVVKGIPCDVLYLH